MLPWAAVAFSLIWGTVIGLAATKGNPGLAAFAGVGMLFTLGMTALLHRQQIELRDLAETDTLTGLINHRGFQRALRTELQKASEKREPLALVALDIDDFIAFQTYFAIGDPRADFNADGALDVDDFLAFQTAFALCPS